MKRTFALLAALLLTMTGCAPKQPEGLEETPMDAPLFDVLTERERGCFQGFADNFPAHMTVRCDQVYPDAVVEDAALIAQMYDAICQIRIKAETNLSVTDAYHSVVFQTGDGEAFGLGFEQHILCVGSHHYVLTNDGAFWRLFSQIAEEYNGQSASTPLAESMA